MSEENVIEAKIEAFEVNEAKVKAFEVNEAKVKAFKVNEAKVEASDDKLSETFVNNVKIRCTRGEALELLNDDRTIKVGTDREGESTRDANDEGKLEPETELLLPFLSSDRNKTQYSDNILSTSHNNKISESQKSIFETSRLSTASPSVSPIPPAAVDAPYLCNLSPPGPSIPSKAVNTPELCDSSKSERIKVIKNFKDIDNVTVKGGYEVTDLYEAEIFVEASKNDKENIENRYSKRGARPRILESLNPSRSPATSVVNIWKDDKIIKNQPDMLGYSGMIDGRKKYSVNPGNVIEPKLETDAIKLNEYLGSDIFCYKLEKKTNILNVPNEPTVSKSNDTIACIKSSKNITIKEHITEGGEGIVPTHQRKNVDKLASNFGQNPENRPKIKEHITEGGEGILPTHQRKNVKKIAAKVSPKSKSQTPELTRILRRIREKKQKRDSKADTKTENLVTLSHQNEPEHEIIENQVSILRKNFENGEHIVKKCRSNTLKSLQKNSDSFGLKRLRCDMPLPKMGTPPTPRVGRRRGTPNKKGKKIECTLEKNQLKLFDFWERKSKLEPKDHNL